jgi:molybdenum cofactor cytidylyltransferase
VLAAGAGRRFGGEGAKLLAPWLGRALLEHVLATVVAARRAGLVQAGVVVHPPGGGAIREAALAAGLVPVPAEGPDLSASLRSGIAALPGGDAALILLGDQPVVKLETIRALIQAAPRLTESLVRPRYREAPDVPGHPALVGRTHWPLAGEARGDRGLDPLLAARGLRWREIEVEGTNPDVDTPADLERLHPPTPDP